MDSITTKINADITLREPAGGIRFGTDALLLAYFAAERTRRGEVVDLGTGAGAMPLLLLASGSRAHFTGVEISEPYARAASENAKENGFSESFRVINGDVREIKKLFPAGTASAVISNPPYMKPDCGKGNCSEAMLAARRELSGGASDFCLAAAHCLKNGGRFFAVYRPDRTAELLCAMRGAGLEPKRIRLVIPSHGRKPSLLLVEGRKSSREGLVFDASFCIYTDSSHTVFGEEMQKVYKLFSGKDEKR